MFGGIVGEGVGKIVGTTVYGSEVGSFVVGRIVVGAAVDGRDGIAVG